MSRAGGWLGCAMYEVMEAPLRERVIGHVMTPAAGEKKEVAGEIFYAQSQRIHGCLVFSAMRDITLGRPPPTRLLQGGSRLRPTL